MKKPNPNKPPEAFLVFQKFINLFLFDSINDPDFRKSNFISYGPSLLKYLKKTKGEKDIVKTVRGDKLMRKITEKYIQSLTIDEKATFFYCYIFEYYKPEIFLLESFFPNLYNNENEVIMENLAMDKIHPFAQDFINQHFVYLFNHIKRDSIQFSLKQYEELCSQYLKANNYKSLFEDYIKKPFTREYYENN